MDVGDMGGFGCWDRGRAWGGGLWFCEEWGISFCACASGIVIRVSVRMGLRMRLA